jgi:hypothetical protein
MVVADITEAQSDAIAYQQGRGIKFYANQKQYKVAIDLRGRMHPRHAFWNASDDAPPARLRADYALLPRIAEEKMAVAAKDISMGGIAGTALMLCEASGVGATLRLDAIPRPADLPWARWLQRRAARRSRRWGAKRHSWPCRRPCWLQ